MNTGRRVKITIAVLAILTWLSQPMMAAGPASPTSSPMGYGCRDQQGNA
jgi:hypothetical protein